MIYDVMRNLIRYGISNGLINQEDTVYVTNLFLDLFELDENREDEITSEEKKYIPLEEILKAMADYAYEKGILKEKGIEACDLFETKVMGLLTPRPAAVSEHFWKLYQESPKAATDFYYKFSQDTNYIRRDRIKKDIRWIAGTEYGELDISINLSKPEKDPKAIAAAKLAKQNGYPKCMLCPENVGYAGRVNYPARQNHRIIPVTILNQPWALQYSPYVYYNEHCILLNMEHTPMRIDQDAFRKLLDFVRQFPHYFMGSNADLPIVGGSILSHEHFQGGNYEFAMAKAPVERYITLHGFEEIETGVVKWPMSVIRLRGGDEKRLAELGDIILQTWRAYTDEAACIYAFTGKKPHNTITPIARKKEGSYELDLVLRNNLTTKEHPLGLYHPHAELHHIKKENIGLIEVMGLAILPARLINELELLEKYLVQGKNPRENELLIKHADWAEEIISAYPVLTAENVRDILKIEIGNVFCRVLEHAGVYKRTGEGQKAFDRFLEAVNKQCSLSD